MNITGYNKNYIMGGFDKRQVPRIKLATIVPMDSSKWDLELSKPANAPELEVLLGKYDDQNIEDNVFFGKTFLTAAFGRMNSLETNFITVWETIDGDRYLRMYFPVVNERIGFPGTNVWRCWSHDYAPLGVPIVSSHDAGEVLDRFLQLLAQLDYRKIPALVFGDIPLDGVFAGRMREAMEGANTPFREIIMGERAVLHSNRLPQSSNILEISSKKRRQLDRQLRRLGELGDLQLERVDQYKNVILRFEEFLLLEAKGWKGRKGTSMHTIKQTAAFARQAVTDLAKTGNSAIYTIRLNGSSIASLIVLQINGIFYPWKIAFDQDFSHHSPGALLMYQVSQEISSHSDFIRADSLAGQSNQLVNLLWKQRMTLGSLILPTGQGSRSQIDKIAVRIERKRDLRDRVKKLLKR